MSLNEVTVLFEGYSNPDPCYSNITRANCSCTLIRTRGGKNVIVDTMTAWDGARLVEALREKSELEADDIDVVVCTHGHSDHIGCNYLFCKAKWHVVGTCVSHEDKYKDWCYSTVPLEIDGDDVVVQHTPGHTLCSVSVLVRHTSLGDVAICGDLFERFEDIDDESVWLNAGSDDPNLQRQQRVSIAEKFSYIIPGHGTGFVVTDEIRTKLRRQLTTKSNIL